jgi:hypothetical protein
MTQPEPVTDPANAEQAQEVPDTPDSDEQRAADEQRAEEQLRAEHDFQEQEQPVTVERSGPEQVHPAGQPSFVANPAQQEAAGDQAFVQPGQPPYAETRDPASAGEREDNSGLVGATEPAMASQPVGATANETPVLPASAQAGAAKAHAVLGHLVKVAQAAQAEIERYVPAELVTAAERDAALFIRSVL